MPKIRIGQLLRPSLLAPLFCLLYAFALLQSRGDALVLVTLGERFAPAELATYSEEGYDGQFAYYLARYGLEGAEPYLDLPAYRAQRILLIGLAVLGALGRVDLLPYSFLAVNLLALGIGTYFLERLLIEQNSGKRENARWFAMGYAFALGVFGATRLNTAEPLAYALVIGGIYAMRRERWWLGALIFALAALSKETTLFFPAAYGFLLLYRREWLKALLFASIVLVPFLAWQGILYQVYGTLGIGSGGGGATSFELIPFGGVLQIITATLQTGDFAALTAFMLLVGVFVLVPTLWALWRVLLDLRYTYQVRLGQKVLSQLQGWTMGTSLLFANVAMMPFVPFSTYREPLGILRFIVGLQIALILYASERRQKRVLLYSTLWFVTSFLVIASDFA